MRKLKRRSRQNGRYYDAEKGKSISATAARHPTIETTTFRVPPTRTNKRHQLYTSKRGILKDQGHRTLEREILKAKKNYKPNKYRNEIGK